MSLGRIIEVYAKEGISAAYLNMYETNADKVGVISFIGTKVSLEIHDPIFLEKLSEFIPSKIDRFGSHAVLGEHITGERTMMDERARDKEFMIYWAKVIKALGVQFARSFLPIVIEHSKDLICKISDCKGTKDY